MREAEERPGADVVSPDPSAAGVLGESRRRAGGRLMRAEARVEKREKGKARRRAAASPPTPVNPEKESQQSSPREGEGEGESRRDRLHSLGPGEKSRGFEAANHWGLLATLK